MLHHNLFFNAGRLVAISPQHGAETIAYLASSPEVAGVSGKYFVNKRARRSSRISYDPKIAGQLWQMSRVLTRLDNPEFAQTLSSP